MQDELHAIAAQAAILGVAHAQLKATVDVLTGKQLAAALRCTALHCTALMHHAPTHCHITAIDSNCDDANGDGATGDSVQCTDGFLDIYGLAAGTSCTDESAPCPNNDPACCVGMFLQLVFPTYPSLNTWRDCRTLVQNDCLVNDVHTCVPFFACTAQRGVISHCLASLSSVGRLCQRGLPSCRDFD